MSLPLSPRACCSRWFGEERQAHKSKASRQPKLTLAICSQQVSNMIDPTYYEARIDYTNNSETINLCNRCVCIIGKLIPRQFMCVIDTFTISTLWRLWNYTNNSCQKALCNRCPVQMGNELLSKCSIGPSRITQLIPQEFSGVTEVILLRQSIPWEYFGVKGCVSFLIGTRQVGVIFPKNYAY